MTTRSSTPDSAKRGLIVAVLTMATVVAAMPSVQAATTGSTAHGPAVLTVEPRCFKAYSPAPRMAVRLRGARPRSEHRFVLFTGGAHAAEIVRLGTHRAGRRGVVFFKPVSPFYWPGSWQVYAVRRFDGMRPVGPRTRVRVVAKDSRCGRRAK